MTRLDDYRPVHELPRSAHGGTPFDLTDFVTTSLLKRALRAAGMHHVLAGAPCTFVIIGIPDGALSHFTDAVENLLRRSGRDPNCARSKVHDRTGMKAERTKSVEVAVPSLQSHRSTCWLYDTRDDVPEFIATIADGIAEIPAPDRRLLRAMASRVRVIEPMKAGDLERVMSMPWHLLTSFVEGGRSFRAAADLVSRIEAARSAEPTAREKEAASEKNSDAAGCGGAVPDGPTLDELPGLGEAAEWGRTLAVDLEDYTAGRIGWTEVDRGALLHGLPGTGKTTFALALGRTCGVPVHVHSLARWQAAGYLNALLKAMRTAFSEALAAAPCILFVDELDSFGDRANVDDHNARYTREVINGFLECLDGAEGRPGVVVIGATNHPHLIDPAIRRAGRLDREIVIPLPNADAREKILRFHLRGDLPGVDLREVADAMDGKSGADVEVLVRSARRTARTARRPMELGDLVQALPPAVRLTDAAFRRVCVHEAGHVVVGQALAAVSGSIPVKAVAKREQRSANPNQTEFILERGIEGTLASYLRMVTVMLGGLAAELEILGESSELSGGAPDADLARATRLVARMELDLGLGASLATMGRTPDDEVAQCLRQDRALMRRVDQSLAECLKRARGFVRERRGDLETVASCLEERGMWLAPLRTSERPVVLADAEGKGKASAASPRASRGPARAARS